jgi:geranylgeranyl pyrophosphate synthase
MESVEEIIEQGNKMIRNFMHEMLPFIEDSYLRDLTWEYRKRGGKSLRGILTMLVCEACGGNSSDALPAAASIEWEQDWLLIHDDIEDDSELRRGKTTLHKMVGIPIAINVGDYVRIFAGLALEQGKKIWGSETFSDLMKFRYKVLKEVAEGQHMEMIMREKPLQEATEKFYFELIDKKSASYTCGLPAYYGSTIAGLDKAQVAEIVNAIRKIGIPFQIQDDILDLTERLDQKDLWGKMFAGDVAEGKRTLLAIWTDQRAEGKDKERHRQIYGKRDASIEEKREWVAIANKYGVIEDAQKLAKKLMNEALREIKKVIPSTHTKIKLIEFLKFFVNRKY